MNTAKLSKRNIGIIAITLLVLLIIVAVSLFGVYRHHQKSIKKVVPVKNEIIAVTPSPSAECGQIVVMLQKEYGNVQTTNQLTGTVQMLVPTNRGMVQQKQDILTLLTTLTGQETVNYNSLAQMGTSDHCVYSTPIHL